MFVQRPLASETNPIIQEDLERIASTKLTLKFTHLSQIERNQIASLINAQQTIRQIAKVLGRDKSTISRKLSRIVGLRGYRPKQASEMAKKCPAEKRNSHTIGP
jgi:IS30 family transposase